MSKKPRSYEKINSLDTDVIISEVDTMLHILDNQKNIIPFKKKNVITVISDSSCSMSCVTLNGEHMMTGNNWDFHPGCHGGRLRILGYLNGTPSWNGVSSLVILISDYIKNIARSLGDSRLSSDTTIEVKYYDAKYNDSGDFKNKKLTDTVKVL